MADTAVSATLPNAAPIAGAAPAASPQLLDILTALLHANPPATSVDQASPEVKAKAGADAKATQSAADSSSDSKAATAKPAAKTQTTLPDVLKMLGVDIPGGQGSPDTGTAKTGFEGSKIGKAAATISALLKFL